MSEGEVKEKLDQNQELFTALSSETGLHIKDFDDIQSLYSTLKAEVCIQPEFYIEKNCKLSYM